MLDFFRCIGCVGRFEGDKGEGTDSTTPTGSLSLSEASGGIDSKRNSGLWLEQYLRRDVGAYEIVSSSVPIRAQTAAAWTENGCGYFEDRVCAEHISLRSLLKNAKNGATKTETKNQSDDCSPAETSPAETDELLFLAVFDGHGGTEVADCLQKNLVADFKTQLLQRLENAFPGVSQPPTPNYIISASLQQAIAQAEERAMKTSEAVTSGCGSTSSFSELCGSCATVSVVVPGVNKAVITAQVGDSMALLRREKRFMGVTPLVPAVHVHSVAENEKERGRVRTVVPGCVFSPEGRVEPGGMMVTRSVGDRRAKEANPGIIASPDISVTPLHAASPDIAATPRHLGVNSISSVTPPPPPGSFVVLVSDGVTDALSHADIVAASEKELRKGGGAEEACRAVLRTALQGSPSCDNMACVVHVLSTFEKPVLRRWGRRLADLEEQSAGGQE